MAKKYKNISYMEYKLNGNMYPGDIFMYVCFML